MELIIFLIIAWTNLVGMVTFNFVALMWANVGFTAVLLTNYYMTNKNKELYSIR